MKPEKPIPLTQLHTGLAGQQFRQPENPVTQGQGLREVVTTVQGGVHGGVHLESAQGEILDRAGAGTAAWGTRMSSRVQPWRGGRMQEETIVFAGPRTWRSGSCLSASLGCIKLHSLAGGMAVLRSPAGRSRWQRCLEVTSTLLFNLVDLRFLLVSGRWRATPGRSLTRV